MEELLKKIYKKYNLKVKTNPIIVQALTHSSYANEKDCEHNERLEFLGDSILGFLVAEYLYKITSLYNKFYAENKVLAEENKELQESWLVLTKLVYDINNLLLDVLGIKVPEKM